jgi:hypothetical protein
VYQPDEVYLEPAYINFGIGLMIGPWLNHDFDWHGHRLFVWGHDHPRPSGWWQQRPGERPHNDHITVWQSRNGRAPGVGDRGWETHHEPSRPVEHPVGRPGEHPGEHREAPVATHREAPVVEHREAPAPAHREAPVAEHPAEAHPHPATGALTGIQNSRTETHQASTRGQESREAAKPAEPAHSAPPPHAEAPSHTEAPSHADEHKR